MNFRGTFEHTLDAKNRLTVPSRFRAVLSDGVVLAKAVEPCVQLWTPDRYDAYTSAALAGRNPMAPKTRELQRYFAANAVDAELDAAGRVMLPGFLIRHAGLDRDVTVTGGRDHLEIWDRTAWESYNDRLPARVNEIAESLDDTS